MCTGLFLLGHPCCLDRLAELREEQSHCQLLSTQYYSLLLLTASALQFPGNLQVPVHRSDLSSEGLNKHGRFLGTSGTVPVPALLSDDSQIESCIYAVLVVLGPVQP